MKKNTLFAILCAIVTAFVMISCKGGKQTSCAFYVYCSNDLLEQATPEITYLTSNGAEQTIVLDEKVSRSQFVNGIVRKASQNIVVGEDTMKLTRFYVNVLSSGWTHTYEATVKYLPKETEETHDALMYHCLNADCKVVNTTNGYEQNKSFFTSTNPDEIKNLDKFRVNASQAGSFVKDLAGKSDYFKLTITDGVFGEAVLTTE